MIYSLTRNWLNVNKFYASKQSKTIGRFYAGRFYAGKYVQAVKKHGRIKLYCQLEWLGFRVWVDDYRYVSY